MDPRKQSGISLIEITIAVALIGLGASLSMLAWQSLTRKAKLISTARSAKMVVGQARLLSVYRGVNHFVVFDADGRSLQIFEDSSAPLGSFDDGDTLVSAATWADSVEMELPAEPSPLEDPQSGATLSEAWSLPPPDSAARWGSTLKGVMTAPSGLIMSAEATPQVIGVGSVVLTVEGVGTTAVGINGRAGSSRSFQLEGASWKEI